MKYVIVKTTEIHKFLFFKDDGTYIWVDKSEATQFETKYEAEVLIKDYALHNYVTITS